MNRIIVDKLPTVTLGCLFSIPREMPGCMLKGGYDCSLLCENKCEFLAELPKGESDDGHLES